MALKFSKLSLFKTLMFCFVILPILTTIGSADDRTRLNTKHVKNYIFGDCRYDIDHDTTTEDIQFVLANGTLTEYDVAAGAFIEYGFEGRMELRVVKNKKTLNAYTFLPHNPKSITLPGGDHQLSCQDLNSDGNVDFPLRSDWQNRSDYLIYSVSPAGQITTLPIHNKSGYLPMVDNKQTLSTKEISLKGGLLCVNNAQYNSDLARTHGYNESPFHYYKWDGQAFTNVELTTTSSTPDTIAKAEVITAKIHGTFSGYSDLSDWTLFVDEIPKDNQGGKGLSPSGEFELIVKNVKPGKYYLRFGDHGSGMLRITINRPDIDLGIIEHDI